MKCKYCEAKLNPYLLEQIFDNDSVEIRCWKCRKSNFVSLETYFYIKKDYDMPTIEPIGNKWISYLNEFLEGYK